MTFSRRLLAALALCLCAAFCAAATTRVAAPVARPAPAPVSGAATEPAAAAAAATPLAPRPAPLPRVALETSLGRIVIELYPHQAPATVANFLDYARNGHYNGTVFHRAIYGVLVQGGGFTVDLQPKPEREPVGNEATNGLRNTRGTLAAARRPGDRNSAGAQFFINLGDNHAFDRRGDAPDEATGYCVFGRVIDGLDVADRIAALPTTARAPFAADVPVVPVVIERTDLLPATPVTP
jgi:cyclophilin family peptidyl-prolyl cis-trans isomerase